MSRVHEAMMRAAAEAGPEAPTTAVRPERSADAFTSAWQFDRDLPGSAPVRSELQPGPVLAPAMAPPDVTRFQAVARKPRPVPAPPAAVHVGDPPYGGAPSEPMAAPASVRLDSLLAMNWSQLFAPDVAEKLVVSAGADPVAVAQYRRLAETLVSAPRVRGGQIVLVTSARAGEGSTLTSSNLALTLSEVLEQRVLLVDANLRHPTVHRIFQISAGRGVSAGLEAAIEVTRRLVVLPAGRPATDPARVPDAARIGQVLNGARASFDWIVVDGPAALESTETAALAGLADLSVLVVDARGAQPGNVQEAIERIGRERIAGILLNRVSRDSPRPAPDGTPETRA